MNLSFFLQQARPSDLEPLLQMVRDFHEEGHLPFHPVITRQTVLDVLENEVLGRIWLVLEAHSPVGYMVLTRFHSIEFGGSCYLCDEVYLTPPVRGKGLGNTMLEEVIARSKKEEVRALFLEVEADNLPAVKLYTRHGFKTRPYILKSLLL